MDLKKIPELLADQMGLDAEYLLGVISGMRDRLEADAKREHAASKKRGDGDDEKALRLACEYYIFVYVMKILESLVEDVEVEEVREAKEEILGRQKKLLN